MHAQLTLDELTEFMREIEDQPAWRRVADRESDYCDGNQIDSEILQRMQELGIPPAIEPLIGPTIAAVLGMEVRNRGDWQVIADTEGGEEVSDALNHELHQAEDRSRADQACSDAFAAQTKVGMGWVHVGREDNPFEYQYRVESIHRREIWWDWLAKPDLSDARWLIRRRWYDKRVLALMFPDSAELIDRVAGGWAGMLPGEMLVDESTLDAELYASQHQERAWSIDEMSWRDTSRNRVALVECWYRRWERAAVLRSPDGRVVEFDRKNPRHSSALSLGATIVSAVVPRVYQSYWVGPHKLSDAPSPYKHNRFPYVPFFGYREDRSGVPYGLVRGMLYLQDQINALHSKSQWMLAARRTVRTYGAVLADDEQFRQEVARPDADIILDAKAMERGGIFRVDNDMQLTEQQFRRLQDSREGLRRVGGIYSEFQGQNNNTTSGVQFSAQVEQSNQALGDLMDNFKNARMAVGELLLSLIIEDMAGQQKLVTIQGYGLAEPRSIALNEPAVDPQTGVEYLNNDVSLIRARVGINTVPSAVTFKQQQLYSMSEAFKSAPPQYQPIMLPFLLSLMDLPHKDDLVRAIKEADNRSSPEQVEQQIKDAVNDALAKARHTVDMARLEQQQPLIDAQVRKTIAEAVNKGVEGLFSATQAASNIAVQPMVAPLADSMLHSVGFQDQDAPPIMPVGVQGVPTEIQAVPPPVNTNPLTPVNPAVGADAGIEGGQNERIMQ